MKAMRVSTRLSAYPEDCPTSLGIHTLIPDPSLQEAVCFLSKILVYKPKERLGGRNLLSDRFFNSICQPGARRFHGQLISTIITPDDIREAQADQPEKRTSRLSQLMNRKADFVFVPTDEKYHEYVTQRSDSRSNSDKTEFRPDSNSKNLNKITLATRPRRETSKMEKSCSIQSHAGEVRDKKSSDILTNQQKYLARKKV